MLTCPGERHRKKKKDSGRERQKRTASLLFGIMWGVLILGVLFRGALTQISEENLGWNFVNEYNDKVGSLWNENVKKAWNYYTNITGYNLEVMVCST